MDDTYRCQWCAEPVEEPGLCERCQDEPDAVVPRTVVLTTPLEPGDG